MSLFCLLQCWWCKSLNDLSVTCCQLRRRDMNPLTSKTMTIYISRFSGSCNILCCSIAKRKLMAVFVSPLHSKQYLILIYALLSLQHWLWKEASKRSGISKREPCSLCVSSSCAAKGLEKKPASSETRAAASMPLWRRLEHLYHTVFMGCQ